MACDKTKQEYHLTQGGWVVGTYYFFNNANKKVAPPVDRIETWVLTMVQSHPMASEDYSVECVWESEDVSKRERDAIRKKFPKPWADELP